MPLADDAAAQHVECAIEQRFRVALAPGAAVAQLACMLDVELVRLQFAVGRDFGQKQRRIEQARGLFLQR